MKKQHTLAHTASQQKGWFNLREEPNIEHRTSNIEHRMKEQKKRFPRSHSLPSGRGGSLATAL
jgi:hypothetical protein